GAASGLARALLARGFLVTPGGGGREICVLTPPLTVHSRQLDAFVETLPDALREAER
ncbi:MAG: aspartate aminotransferase family protein, partial [Deltaproteobacteria bacterium]|nr:aspartate aminotransferase family protein [Deltaproteobacteria bacterium]